MRIIGRAAILAAATGAGALIAAAPIAHADADAVPGPSATQPAVHTRSAAGGRVAVNRSSGPRPSGANHAATGSAVRSPATRAAAAQSLAPALSVSSPVAESAQAARSGTLSLVDGIIKGSADRFHLFGTTTLTVVEAPSAGGKVTPLVPSDTGYSSGAFTYLPDESVLKSAQREQFSILATHDTIVSQVLQKLPIIGQWVVDLRQIPILNALLAPIIGYTRLSHFDSSMVNIPAGTPVAYTAMVKSFDGTPISTNFFPASTVGPYAVPAGDAAPTILFGPGLHQPGVTDPYSAPDWMPLVAQPRDHGYNVITWDPRGMGASGGVMHWDSPAYEGRDVVAILDWSQGVSATGQNNVFAAKVGPRFGMTGASYGGAIQLVAAALDNRIKAIVPVITWNSLPNSFYPDAAYKTSFDFVLRSTPTDPGITVIDNAGLAVAVGGVMSDTALAELAGSGPSFLIDGIRTPTLLVQATTDTLFPLQEAMTTEAALAANHVPVKSIWYCGGHGDCLDPPNHKWGGYALNAMLAWLDQYVKQAGTPADSVPAFQYVDQHGVFYRSDLLPTDPNFTTSAITAHSPGGALDLVPFTGGSGPVRSTGWVPVALPNAGGAPAFNAVNVPIPSPGRSNRYVAGSPQLSFSYSGTGDSRFVYAQLVDNTTGRVLGNIVTPIPVTLDGQQHRVDIPMAAIAYTMYRTDSLTLQITSSATAFATIPQSGRISISDITVSLPTTTAVTRVAT